MSVLARTEDHPPAERLEYWRHVLSEAFVPLEATPLGVSDDRLVGNLRHASLGVLQIAEVSGSSQQVRRRSGLIRRQDPGLIKFGLQVRGRGVIAQDGREAALSPGDLVAYDTSRSYSLRFPQSFRMLVVMCPRSTLGLSRATLANRTAVRIDGRNGVGGLIAPFVTRLAEALYDTAGAFGDGTSHHLAEATAELLTAGLNALHGDVVPADSHASLLYRLRTYIEANLGCSELGSTAIAAHHHISVRYLQKLFEQQNCTVSSWIRTRRLEHCRRDLSDPDLSGIPIGKIATKWGLVDAAHFSRAFRAMYGTSPRDYRRSSFENKGQTDRRLTLVRP